MRAKTRDGIVVAILLGAGVAIRLAWHPLGPWVSLGVAFAAALAVIAVYRIRPHSGPPRPPAEEAPQPPVPLHRDQPLLRRD